MAGKVENPTSANDAVYEKNLKYAVGRFASEDIVGLIEPINSITVPHYYMNNFQKGILFNKQLVFKDFEIELKYNVENNTRLTNFQP